MIQEREILMRGYVTPLDFDAADDTAAIQCAVDFGAKRHLRVVIPAYNPRTDGSVWEIARAVRLHTGSSITIDNCTLRQTDECMENIFRNSNKGTDVGFTPEGRQSDITITGLGDAVLDGAKHNGLCERVSMKDGYPHVTENSPINFLNVARVRIENLRIVRQRYWGMTFHYCSDVRISGIDFYGVNENLNSDGIDLRTGCSDFVIENITGITEDDTIALTNLRSIYDERMQGFDDSIHDVVIRNVCSATPRGIIRLLNHYGKKIYNVTVENIMESMPFDRCDPRVQNTAALEPISFDYQAGSLVRIGESAYYRSPEDAAKLGEMHNITVRNLFGHARMGVRVSCALCDADFDNIHVVGDGGTALYFGEGVYRRITASHLTYAPNNIPHPIIDNRKESSYNKLHSKETYPDREVCAVYFKEADTANLYISDIDAGKNLTAVFGGYGKVLAKVCRVTRQDEAVPMLLGNGLALEIE